MYSQVVIPQDRVVVCPGRQKVKLTVVNRYDFTNLDKLKGTWELLHNGKNVSSGAVSASGPPHRKDIIAIELDLTDDIETTEHLLRIGFADSYGRQIYERSVHLIPESGKVDFAKRLSTENNELSLQSVKRQDGVSSCQFCCMRRAAGRPIDTLMSKVIQVGVLIHFGHMSCHPPCGLSEP